MAPKILRALLVLLFATACRAPGGASIAWPELPGDREAVQLRGLSSEQLEQLSRDAPGADADRAAFVVYVDVDGGVDGGVEAVPMAGSYRLHEGTLHFRPSFDWTPNLFYVARYKEAGGARRVLSERHMFAAPEPEPSTLVQRIYPSAELLPDNLLRVYLHFSAPMRRGQAYQRVRILDADGQEVYEPFIPFSQELWDPSSTRLTLLLDPGRIKRGLVPNEVFGPPLLPGRDYTLVVDAGWRDARGVELAEAFEHGFRTVASDREQPDVGQWQFSVPAAGGREALVLTFPEPLDHAQLLRMIRVQDSSAANVVGEVSIGAQETSWRFVPDSPWTAGRFELVIDPLLEDLSGNSFSRPFEVALENSMLPQSDPEPIRRAFLIAE